ncbi:hypothetical protein A2U01_0039421, partial [Trifolium medium]|nr:hypothetical protein [Trifolium medium]
MRVLACLHNRACFSIPVVGVVFWSLRWVRVVVVVGGDEGVWWWCWFWRRRLAGSGFDRGGSVVALVRFLVFLVDHFHVGVHCFEVVCELRLFCR